MRYWPDAMVTRCLENRVFAAMANRVGDEDRGGVKFHYTGNSEIVSYRGEILHRLGESAPGIAVAEIDPTLALNKNINEYNDLFRGRQTRYYTPGDLRAL